MSVGREPMAHEQKVEKQAVLYEGPELNKKDFTCAGCMMFFKSTSECAVVEPKKVAPQGGCGLWVGGDVMGRPDEHHMPMELVPQSVAGYTDAGPFTCKRCTNFKPMGEYGECKVVEGVVHKDGCCNAWSRNQFYQIENASF